MYKITFLFIFVLSSYSITKAQISVITDYNLNSSLPGGISSEYYYFNNKLYFSSHDWLNGNELWVTDGTESGTKILKDIYPGVNSSEINWGSPKFKIIYHNQLFFYATSSNGDELWKTDGTTEGTVMVKDIYLGKSGSSPSSFIIYNDLLYFVARDGEHGWELWKTDGTESGTVMVKDINPGSSDSQISSVIEFNGFLFFSANNGTTGKELWKSDGTETGTVLVKDINPGLNLGVPDGQLFRIYNGCFYFLADNGTNGTELWKSDGTENGTVLVKDIYNGATGSSLKLIDTLNNQLIFLANDGVHGAELWKTNGTNIGTTLLKDIYAGTKTANCMYLKKFGSCIYFSADDSTHGAELWKTDGTSNGTQLIRDIRAGKTASSPKIFVQYNGNVYFTATDGITGIEVWLTDGTESGTKILKDLNTSGSSNASAFCVSGGKLFFNAVSPYYSKLFVTDGTELGTQQVADLFPNTDDYPGSFFDYNGKLVYVCKNKSSVYVPCISDGTYAGTKVIRNICTYNSYSGFDRFCSFNNNVLFSTSTEEIFKTNGTIQGTEVICNRAASSNYLKYKNDVYFVNSTDSIALCKISANTLEPLRIKAFPGSLSASSELFLLNDTLYFTIATSGTELWRTDGTKVNTMKVDYNGALYPTNHVPVDNKIFFKASTSLNGRELWCSNGKTSYMVKEIYPGLGVDQPMNIIAFKDKAFFIAEDGIHGAEIWSSDGTEPGTKLLKDINPSKAGYASAPIKSLLVSGNYLYFFANDSVHGYEPWLTDGTAQGTRIVKDINQYKEDINLT
jgi:ELWxxDGT repeat protein